MPTVVLIGTLDTKGSEYAWLAYRLRARGAEVVLMNVGVLGDALAQADVQASDVAAAAGTDLADLRTRADRGAATTAMAEGAATILRDLYEQGRVDGVLAVGGSGGSAIASHAMRALPVGVPKLLVSTMAAGDVSPYVGAVDVTMMYSVVDIAGINRLSERILGNAADAIAGMAGGFAEDRAAVAGVTGEGRPLIAASMFGVTTPAVDAARERLTELGYEVLVFHATGAGGTSMENLAEAGFLAGILDLTTTELADDLVGGVLTAGPERLGAAGRMGLPQVVSVGALDMVNFGPRDTVPERFEQRKLYVHNPTVTLMRTTPEENAELGRRIAAKLVAATGPTALYLPLRGVSAIDVEGAPFHDPAADAALFDALRVGLAGSSVELYESDTDINDPAFATAAADRLHHLIIKGSED
ncbi:Tm-1-like ATP-binding domain-containing protein [Embleya sp. NBC_00896]|uniref:Tm-1-like ATP-binding domain-containing protein n=1 Tax=Embleya sp. NBC_00896 TaxID=2975961 RepID=UPI00386BE7FB|nr:Tm-1-like ATP-binding domain-containing protein [Embleya sp. NBC_00896]